MTSTILRTVLVVSVLFGVGIVANIMTNKSGGPGTRQDRLAFGRPSLVSPPATMTRLSPAASARKTLEAVRRELEGRGYLATGRSSGLDVATKAAILAFEFDHNLPLTALPTEEVLAALIFKPAPASGPSSSTPESDAARQVIVEVQRALAHLGYARPEITAELDPETRKAIYKFERARGLQASGRISAPLIESLGPAFDSARIGLVPEAGERGRG